MSVTAARRLLPARSHIRPEWLAGARTVGLTAGAPAPSRLVEEVIAALGGLGPVAVGERETTRDTSHFTLPSAVRPA